MRPRETSRDSTTTERVFDDALDDELPLSLLYGSLRRRRAEEAAPPGLPVAA